MNTRHPRAFAVFPSSRAFACFILLLLAFLPAKATVLFEDNFSSYSGTGNSVNPFGWYNENATTTAVGLWHPWQPQGSEAKFMAHPGGSGAWTSVLKSFNSTTLNVGQTLTLSFKVAKQSATSGDLVVGFLNLGSPVTQDQLGTTVYDGKRGIYLRQGFADGSTAKFVQQQARNPMQDLSSPAASSNLALSSSEEFTSVSLSFYRSSANTLTLSAMVGGVSIPAQGITTSDFTFDTVRLYAAGNNSGSVRFDDIRLEFNPASIPEPGSAAAIVGGAVALLALAGRSRRKGSRRG